MKPNLRSFYRRVSKFVLAYLLLAGVVLAILMVPNHTVVALPEYANRTGEACAACHVSAGGGGPRTLRGLLWAARGKPDKVPSLPGALIAPRVTNYVELYQIACAGCHGMKGEGSSAMKVVNTHIDPNAIRSFILNGIPKRGMPGFEGQFTSDQLDLLVMYVAGISNGEISPPLDSYPLEHPALVFCGQDLKSPVCIHPAFESEGN